MGMSPRLLRPRATGFNPKSIANLVAWFDADDASTFTLSGDAVSEWRDKSSNAYSVTQTTANNQPSRTGTVKGRATVDFDGSNDYLFADGTGISAALNGDKSITVVVVGEMHTSAEYAVNSAGTWVSFGSSSSATPFWYMRSFAGLGAGQVQMRNDASATGGTITAASGPAGDGTNADTARDFFICSATTPSQASSVWRTHTPMQAEGDGIGGRAIGSGGPLQGNTTTSAAARPSGTLTANRFAIGCLGRSTFSDFFPARISEVIIYGAELSSADRGKLIAWLGAKYSTTVPVL